MGAFLWSAATQKDLQGSHQTSCMPLCPSPPPTLLQQWSPLAFPSLGLLPLGLVDEEAKQLPGVVARTLSP